MTSCDHPISHQAVAADSKCRQADETEIDNPVDPDTAANANAEFAQEIEDGERTSLKYEPLKRTKAAGELTEMTLQRRQRGCRFP